MLRHLGGIRLNPRKPSQGTDFDLFRRVLMEARDSVSSWDGRLYFVYLPSQEIFLDPQFAPDNEPERQEIFRILQELHIPVIDLLPALKKQKDPWVKTASFLQNPNSKPTSQSRNLGALVNSAGKFTVDPDAIVFFEKPSTLVDANGKKITNWS